MYDTCSFLYVFQFVGHFMNTVWKLKIIWSRFYPKRKFSNAENKTARQFSAQLKSLRIDLVPQRILCEVPRLVLVFFSLYFDSCGSVFGSTVFDFGILSDQKHFLSYLPRETLAEANARDLYQDISAARTVTCGQWSSVRARLWQALPS